MRTLICILFIPLYLPVIGQKISLSSNKIYVKNGEYYYMSDNKLYVKKGSGNVQCLDNIPSIEGIRIVAAREWTNFHVVHGFTLALRYEKICMSCTEKEYAKKNKSIFFHAVDTSTDIPIRNGTLSEPLPVRKEFLNIHNGDFIGQGDDEFNYDFISDKNELYLLLLNSNKLHIYRAKDFGDISGNEWLHVRSMETSLSTEYFIATHMRGNKIVVQFSTQGKILLDFIRGKYQFLSAQEKKKRKYYIVDVDTGYSVRKVSEKKVSKLLK